MRVNPSLDVGFVTVHGAFEELAAATSGLVAARGGIASCHAALAEAKGKVPGLRTVLSATMTSARQDGGSADLRIVA